MAYELKMDGEQFARAVLSVLGQSLALQHLTFSTLLEASIISAKEKKRLKEELFKKLPSVKAEIMDGLYAEFGATPKIG